MFVCANLAFIMPGGFTALPCGCCLPESKVPRSLMIFWFLDMAQNSSVRSLGKVIEHFKSS